MAKAVVLGFVGRDELLQEMRSKVRPHGTVSSSLNPLMPIYLRHAQNTFLGNCCS